MSAIPSRPAAGLPGPARPAAGVSSLRHPLTSGLLLLTLTTRLVELAADSPLFGGSGTGTSPRAAAVVAMLVGAVIGALLLKTSLTLVLVVAAALAGATLVGYGMLVSEG
jgi:hypothetical protein